MHESDGYKMPFSGSMVEDGSIGKLTPDSNRTISVYGELPQDWGAGITASLQAP